jgi:Bacterial Ig domain
MNRVTYYMIAAVMLFACSSDKPTSTGAIAPRSSVSGTAQTIGVAVGITSDLEISPKEATRKTILHLSSTSIDLSRARIEWLVNGVPLTTRVPTQFDGIDAAKGDTVQARVMIQDREVLSNNVQIMNTPPQITWIKLMPEIFKPGDTLGVNAAGKDVDGDEVSFLYEWTKNGEFAANESRIGTSLKRGDNVSVQITPYDGTDYGTPMSLHREIANWPPVIFENTNRSFNGAEYVYQVKASDPDDDPLVYSLEIPLDGMTIDSSTGLFKWIVPPDFTGVKNVTVVVADGHGGTAKYSLTITIHQQPAAL